MNHEIREADETDVEGLHELTKTLGYSISKETMESQLSAILNHADHQLMVATVDNEVIGFIHAFTAIRLTSPTFAEISGLAITETHRFQGLAKKLVRAIEEASKGLPMRVRCNRKRTGAHQFYEKLGYLEVKEQKVFLHAK